MSKQQYRVAFIGAGGIVKYSHIPNFLRLPNIEAVAVCDVNEPRAQVLATEMRIPAVYSDHRRMLDEVKPDITVVATPNAYHKPMSIDALNAGSHVLCEKPLALTYADAKEMYAVARQQGKVLTVGSHYRWTDPMRMTKMHVDAGFFGRIYAWPAAGLCWTSASMRWTGRSFSWTIRSRLPPPALPLRNLARAGRGWAAGAATSSSPTPPPATMSMTWPGPLCALPTVQCSSSRSRGPSTGLMS
ncbi:MAG: hypothetical protein DCC55_12010, partial [Chloroflexi bacterium]